MADPDTQALIDRIAGLEHRIGVMEDVQAIRNLVYAFGYYSDKLMHEETIDCFADDAQLSFRGGVWRGKEGVRRFFSGWLGRTFGGDNGPVYGRLLDHCLMQDIIHVADDRNTASMRYRYFSQGGVHESAEMIAGFWSAYLEGGIAEDTFVREDGVWKFDRWNYMTQWQADYHDGWDKNIREPRPLPELYPESPIGPDEYVDFGPIWPHTYIPPFHYPHPVTGEVWNPSDD